MVILDEHNGGGALGLRLNDHCLPRSPSQVLRLRKGSCDGLCHFPSISAHYVPTQMSRALYMTQLDIDISAVAADARRVLAENRLRGVSEWGGRTYDFVCPSRQSY